MNTTVVPYDPQWAEDYAKEEAALARNLANILIRAHHVGSTAVKDLAAKPIIDILLEVNSLESLDQRNVKLAALGYEAMGEFGIPGRRYFRKGGDHRTHQIHAFLAGDFHILRHLAFRDYLTENRPVALEYQKLKRELARKYPEDIQAYCDGKDPFVKHHEAMAIQSRTAERADELTPNACDTSVIPIEIKILGRGDEDILTKVVPGVFDHAVDCQLSKEFLDDPRHHLAVAIDAGFIVGFASAVHYVHPDKGPELWINEVGVASTHRGRGLATKLLEALFEVGRGVSCTEAWVLTDRSNAAAMRLYSSAGGIESQENEVMYTFPLGPGDRNEEKRLNQTGATK